MIRREVTKELLIKIVEGGCEWWCMRSFESCCTWGKPFLRHLELLANTIFCVVFLHRMFLDSYKPTSIELLFCWRPQKGNFVKTGFHYSLQSRPLSCTASLLSMIPGLLRIANQAMSSIHIQRHPLKKMRPECSRNALPWLQYFFLMLVGLLILSTASKPELPRPLQVRRNGCCQI